MRFCCISFTGGSSSYTPRHINTARITKLIDHKRNQDLDMKYIAVVGYGNMGQRHIDSLQVIGGCKVVVVRRDVTQPLLPRHRHLKIINSLELAIEEGINAVIISNVTSAHASSLMLAMKHKLPVLLEKPVADNLSVLEKLETEAELKADKVLVGYDIRFCGALDHLKHLLNSGQLGDIAFASLDAGGYLPNWRPDLDYRDLYSSNRKLGGGVTLDLVHEIDAMLELFGQPTSLTSTLVRKGNLDLDVEDFAQLTFDFKSGPIITMSLDYLRRPFTRKYTLVGSEGTVVWNAQKGTITTYDDSALVGSDTWNEQLPNAFELEMRHFLDVLDGTSLPVVTLNEGIRSARLALLAKVSSQTGKRIDLSSYAI